MIMIMPIFCWHLRWQAFTVVFELHSLGIISKSNWLVFALMLTLANYPVLFPSKPLLYHSYLFCTRFFPWDTLTDKANVKTLINPVLAIITCNHYTENGYYFYLMNVDLQDIMELPVCSTTSCTQATEASKSLLWRTDNVFHSVLMNKFEIKQPL